MLMAVLRIEHCKTGGVTDCARPRTHLVGGVIHCTSLPDEETTSGTFTDTGTPTLPHLQSPTSGKPLESPELCCPIGFP